MKRIVFAVVDNKKILSFLLILDYMRCLLRQNALKCIQRLTTYKGDLAMSQKNASYCQYSKQYINENLEELISAYYKGELIEVCESKINTDFFYCEDCNEYYHNDEKVEVEGGNHICQSCVDDSYYSCDDCGTIHHTDTTTTIHNGNQVCESCRDDYFWCDSCNDYYHVDDMHSHEDGDMVCSNCIESMYSCPECGHYSEYDHSDGHCCNNCGYEEYNSEDEYDGMILPYDAKPSLDFIGESSKLNPFIGFEIEVEARQGDRYSIAEHCYNEFEKCFLKNDGSLSDGFEVVSHPKTIDEHYKCNYKEAMKEAARIGARSHDTSTCGLHFHFDKKHMSEGHKVRFGMFFSLCQTQLITLARRSSERWCQYKETGLAWDQYKESERYEAVNWTNDDTVEVRIFKGTLKYETFMASMELCLD